MSVTGTIRFLVGATLVAAGVPLVSPLARNIVTAARASSDAHDAAGQAGQLPHVPPGGLAVPAEMPVAPAASAGAPPAAADAAPAPGAWSAMDESVGPDSSGGLQLDRSPPPPPAPLPPLPEVMLQASPSFAAAYRSTLRVPPPDLLDAEGPPPAVSWSAPAGASPPAAANARGAGTTRAAPVAEITVPATYRVRDGDDLVSIAGRFYGHPAAATAIWAANREVITHPDLLPIGVDLRLPPPWAVGTGGHRSHGAIEPAAFARPVAAPAVNPGAAAPARSEAWLAPAADPPPAAGAATPPPFPAPAPVAASVRVAPGETLATLASRLYGDPAMAASLFAANRDRLRSPELVIAGMELRLPRPVTAPRP